MNQHDRALKVARYLMFETLEVLLIPVTAGIFLLGNSGALYLLTMSQETAAYQQMQPGPEEWGALLFIGLFLLAWSFVFYFWRRRAGLRRLVGQCTVVGLCIAETLLWGSLSAIAAMTAKGSFFIAVPCILAVFSVAALLFVAAPLRALIRWQREQRALTKKSI